MSQGVPPSTTPSPANAPAPYRQKLWVPVVLLVGFIIGELISYYSTVPRRLVVGPGFGPGPFNQFPHFVNDPNFQFHIVLTTIGIALLIALLIVYVRMYAETRANFSLGLVVVLFGLLLQALLSYPLVIGFIGTVYLGPGLTSQFADVFTVAAYAIFLYLSLE